MTFIGKSLADLMRDHGENCTCRGSGPAITQPPAGPVEPGHQEVVGHAASIPGPGDPPAASPPDPIEPAWRDAGYSSSIEIHQAEGR